MASESSQRRFIKTYDDYCQSVVQQAADRDKKHIRDVESYFDNRRENIGAKPSFALLELDMNIPDNVMEHQTIVNLTNWAIDMIIMGNVRLGSTHLLSAQAVLTLRYRISSRTTSSRLRAMTSTTWLPSSCTNSTSTCKMPLIRLRSGTRS